MRDSLLEFLKTGYRLRVHSDFHNLHMPVPDSCRVKTFRIIALGSFRSFCLIRLESLSDFRFPNRPKICSRRVPFAVSLWSRGSGRVPTILESNHFDPALLWRRVDHDRDLLRELVAVFAEEAQQQLARIEEGIRAGVAGDVKKASHKLKGSLLQFSARTAVTTAEELEERVQNGLVAEAAPLLIKLRHEIDLLREALSTMVCGPPPAQELKDSRGGTISGE